MASASDGEYLSKHLLFCYRLQAKIANFDDSIRLKLRLRTFVSAFLVNPVPTTPAYAYSL